MSPNNTNQALLDAVRVNDPIKTKFVLEQGADPNYCEDDEAYRPIHFAAMYDANLVIDILATAGADLSAKTDSESLTALEIATRYNHRPTAALLQQYHIITNHLSQQH